MNKPNDDKLKQYRADIRTLKDENKQLQRELRRKEKALAEAAALIILKKKPTHYSIQARRINPNGATSAVTRNTKNCVR